MIVGHGAIASALDDHPGRIYFASGVANSGEIRESEYRREADLLRIMGKDKRLVYFSSLCIFYRETRYARHKREMEALVKELFPRWTIMRLGNIDWATNPHQFVPFIKQCVKQGSWISVWDEYRHLLSKDEFRYWVGMIPEWNCELNVTGERLTVGEVIARYQKA